MLRDAGSLSSIDWSGEVHRPKQLHQLQLHGSLIPIKAYRTHRARLARGLCVSAIN